MRILFSGAAAGATLMLAVSIASAAPCADPPRPPQMPQGATASEEDMKAGHDALQKYVNSLQDYQNCVEAMLKNAPPDTKPELRQQWEANANAAIDAAHEIADVYSIQLRAFKARQQ
jgi:hypothetical protein